MVQGEEIEIISPTKMAIDFAQWYGDQLQLIFNQMMVPKRVLMNMQTFWIKTRNQVALRPGDKVQVEGQAGRWIELEVAYVRPEASETPTFGGPTGDTEIELIVPAGGIHLRTGRLIRAGGCTWALDHDYIADDHSLSSSAIFLDDFLPGGRSFASMQSKDLGALIQNSWDRNCRDWDAGGKEALIRDIAKEMVFEADMFVGTKADRQAVLKIEGRLLEIISYARKFIPRFEMDQIDGELKRIIELISTGINLEHTTARFHQEYLGEPAWADTDRMMREGEKAPSRQRVERPDAPWKLDGDG
jgi:hypothetical protein